MTARPCAIRFVLLVGCLGSACCSAPEPFDKKEFFFKVVERLYMNRCEPSPVPEETPFDADPYARENYLQCWRSGYFEALAGVQSSFCERPYSHPRWRGWQDGQDAGEVVFRRGYEALLAEEPATVVR